MKITAGCGPTCAHLKAHIVRSSGPVRGEKMKLYTRIAIALTVLLAFTALAGAQSWTPLNNQPGVAVGPMLQLRDGRILVNESQGPDTGVWLILTPDAAQLCQRNVVDNRPPA